jgi:hypothetical protein
VSAMGPYKGLKAVRGSPNLEAILSIGGVLAAECAKLRGSIVVDTLPHVLENHSCTHDALHRCGA